MTIDKQLENTKLTISVAGKLNTATAPQLEAEVADLTGVSELVFDLENLEQITSAGLRVLLGAQCAMEEQGKMVVRNVSDAIHEVFVLTGFTNFLTIE